METAKVDIKKLQLLNDRISQCIDALAQVRLSVHGLSHSSGIGAGINPNPMLEGGYGTTDPRLAGLPFAQQWPTGLAHSTLPYAPFGNPQMAFSQQPLPQQLPFAQPFGQQFGQPFGQVGGLSHTGFDVEAYNRPVWSDPFLAAKVAQTFPYVRYAVPPVVSIY